MQRANTLAETNLSVAFHKHAVTTRDAGRENGKMHLQKTKTLFVSQGFSVKIGNYMSTEEQNKCFSLLGCSFESPDIKTLKARGNGRNKS